MKVFFSDRKPMIRILSISFVLYEKYRTDKNGEGDRREGNRRGERHRDIKEHSNTGNKVIINLCIQKCNRTCYWSSNSTTQSTNRKALK